MRQLEFVRLDRKVNYENEEAVYKMHYLHIQPENDSNGKYKDKLYIIVADAYGIPYAFEISKFIRKFTSGKTQSPTMIEYLSEAFKHQELYLDDDGKIDHFEKVLKNAVKESGFC